MTQDPKPIAATNETPCPKREDKQHCEHWYDGERCCACGDGPLAQRTVSSFIAELRCIAPKSVVAIDAASTVQPIAAANPDAPCVCGHKADDHSLLDGVHGAGMCCARGCCECEQFEEPIPAEQPERGTEKLWIASYTASENHKSVLCRGLHFRSIHYSKEDAEKMPHDPQSPDFTVTEYVKVAVPVSKPSPEIEELVKLLRKSAEAATPEPWFHRENPSGNSVLVGVPNQWNGLAVALCQMQNKRSRNNAAHIAAASPENILKLLDHMEGKVSEK